MSKETGVLFLFTIAKELKLSYEYPVILLTEKDYADGIFNILVYMRTAILRSYSTEKIKDLVNTFHFEWLQAVQDVETLKKRIKETPRETILNSVEYTMECVKNRSKYFEQYVVQTSKSISQSEKSLLDAELDIIKDLRDIVGSALQNKEKCLGNCADKTEFTVLISHEITELLNWLDLLNDSLSLQLCKLLELNQLPVELARTLQETIDYMATNPSPEAGKLAKELYKEKTLPSARRYICTFNDTSFNNILEKIKKLEDRIARLKSENSSVMALEHKTIFLKDRLESLENLKQSLFFFKGKKCTQQEKDAVEQEDVHIFNHLLPNIHRCRLVEKLVKHWEAAMGESETKSIISVMRAAEENEEYCDEIGNFTVDEHGRKVYRIKDDPKAYQLNERNLLVPIDDDENHVYFYDECGRYFLTDNSLRVYKAHSEASEYMLHKSGMLLKTYETVDGVEYRYDSIGRYYIDEYGERIYCEKGSDEEYRRDGLGNLEKIRVEGQLESLVHCPDQEPNVCTESFYLKKVVGDALRICVAEVILKMPQDPIKYLADRLEKFYNEIQAKEKRKLDELEIKEEIERLKTLERSSPQSVPSVGSESPFEDESGTDHNFLDYRAQAI